MTPPPRSVRRGLWSMAAMSPATGPQEEGILRWRKALEPLDTKVPVLIENTAGGDKAVARRVEWIARLFADVSEFGVGFVLDTCHVWAGGESFDELVSRVMEATGRIDLVHANDSKDPFDSRRDRHENLGQGRIPVEDLAGSSPRPAHRWWSRRRAVRRSTLLISSGCGRLSAHGPPDPGVQVASTK